MLDVSIIIVNYNTLDLAKNAVASIIKFTEHISYEIILVDNNSNEFSIKELNNEYPRLKIIELDKNLGFGNANNIGAKHARGRYLFLLNSDAYLIDNAIAKYKTILDNDDTIATAGGNLITPEGNPNISYGNFLSVRKILHDYGFKKTDIDFYREKLETSKVCDRPEVTEVDYLTAAAVMIRKTAFDKAGAFDSRYFMYYEDMDLCYRFKKAGFKNVLFPEIKIVHIGGQSGLKLNTSNKKLLREAAYSKYLFLRKVTWLPVALFFYIYGMFKPYPRRIKMKVKKILQK